MTTIQLLDYNTLRQRHTHWICINSPSTTQHGQPPNHANYWPRISLTSNFIDNRISFTNIFAGFSFQFLIIFVFWINLSRLFESNFVFWIKFVTLWHGLSTCRRKSDTIIYYSEDFSMKLKRKKVHSSITCIRWTHRIATVRLLSCMILLFCTDSIVRHLHWFSRFGFLLLQGEHQPTWDSRLQDVPLLIVIVSTFCGEMHLVMLALWLFTWRMRSMKLISWIEFIAALWISWMNSLQFPASRSDRRFVCIIESVITILVRIGYTVILISFPL